MLLLLFILLVSVAICILTTKEPPVVKNIREKYRILKDYLDREDIPEYFKDIDTNVELTFFNKRFNELGYNVNKGQEIGVCIDGDENHAFHVLIHELAHSSVDEYNHSKLYWKRFKELREMCVKLGIYTEIPEKEPFCGQFVKD